ncbi:MAG: hypothetical protein ABI778_03820 [Ignavibacteriota bacterium]
MKIALAGHEVKTVADMKWQGILNGKLLVLAASEFDAFLTVDKNLKFQQNLKSLPLPVIAVHSPSLRWEDAQKYVSKILGILDSQLLPEVYVVE